MIRRCTAKPTPTSFRPWSRHHCCGGNVKFKQKNGQPYLCHRDASRRVGGARTHPLLSSKASTHAAACSSTLPPPLLLLLLHARCQTQTPTHPLSPISGRRAGNACFSRTTVAPRSERQQPSAGRRTSRGRTAPLGRTQPPTSTAPSRLPRSSVLKQAGAAPGHCGRAWSCPSPSAPRPSERGVCVEHLCLHFSPKTQGI